MNLKYHGKKNIMNKKLYTIIAVLAINGAESSGTALDSTQMKELEDRTRSVNMQLEMQMQLNNLTGQGHSTLYKAMEAASMEQIKEVTRESDDFTAMFAVVYTNEMANKAKHKF